MIDINQLIITIEDNVDALLEYIPRDKHLEARVKIETMLNATHEQGRLQAIRQNKG